MPHDILQFLSEMLEVDGLGSASDTGQTAQFAQCHKCGCSALSYHTGPPQGRLQLNLHGIWILCFQPHRMSFFRVATMSAWESSMTEERCSFLSGDAESCTMPIEWPSTCLQMCLVSGRGRSCIPQWPCVFTNRFLVFNCK